MYNTDDNLLQKQKLHIVNISSLCCDCKYDRRHYNTTIAWRLAF